MHPILIKLGPLTIYSYGFMAALGFLVGGLATIYFARKQGISVELILDLAIYVIIAAIFGARLFYVIGDWEQYKNNWLEIFMLQNGGLVFLGGLIFATLAVFIYAKTKGLPYLKILDVITPGVFLGQAIGRIGCFLNGCCFGLPTKMPWGLVFPKGSLASEFFPWQHIHPTQLYSSLSVLIIFGLIIIVVRFKKFDGQVFLSGLIFYSIYRFIVEFFRYSPIHWWKLTPSQWIVMIIFAVALYGWVYLKKKNR